MPYAYKRQRQEARDPGWTPQLWRLEQNTSATCAQHWIHERTPAVRSTGLPNGTGDTGSSLVSKVAFGLLAPRRIFGLKDALRRFAGFLFVPFPKAGGYHVGVPGAAVLCILG